ncbi:MAG: stage V sporulation protein AA [Lachnospiraceae bacterium]|nr:stage V sporulation protein AA [Lachnospiraceae bacterium]
MKENTLYIALEQSILVDNPCITIGDISSIFCKDKNVDKKVRELQVTHLPNTTKAQLVVTVLKLIEIINSEFDNLTIETIGNSETIIYYDSGRKKGTVKQKLKICLLMLIAFFGTAFSIMSYNQDSGTLGLLESLYTLFTGDSPDTLTSGLALGIGAYCIGLTLGMIIFFNHGINRKLTDDPTPLQVQMRLYEQDVNKCIVIDSTRNKKTLDVN